MTTRIVRVGNSLGVEIPEEIAAQISLSAGDLVEWTIDEAGRPQLAKRTIREGLLQVEDQIAEREARDQYILTERLLAEGGDLNAQRQMATLAAIAGKPDEEAKWLELAAEQGDRCSMAHLGRKLLEGEGVDRSIANGYFWLMLHASTYGLKTARNERANMQEERKELHRLGDSLSEEERTVAQDRCHKWLDDHRLAGKCFEVVL